MAEKAKEAEEAEEAEVSNENGIFRSDIVILLENLSFLSFLSFLGELWAGSGAALIVG